MLQLIHNNFTESDASVLIPVIQGIRKADGYLPGESMNHVANIPGGRFYGSVAFYNQALMRSLGDHVTRTCRGSTKLSNY
ncbi:MAG: NAD(P)H-dependent oxidoreductase subunit E [Calditrichaceae bacterium]